MPHLEELAPKDRRLLRELARNGRLSNKELAERVAMSESACLRRVRQLEDAGVIASYRAVINPAMVGRPLSAYVLVNLDQRGETDAQSFLDAIASEPRIHSCAAITGNYDLLLHIRVRDVDDLRDLTIEGLLKLPTVRDLVTCLVLREYPVGADMLSD